MCYLWWPFLSQSFTRVRHQCLRAAKPLGSIRQTLADQMRILLTVLALALIGPAAHANQITHGITDSVQLTVNGAAVTTDRVGSSYSVSGTNVKVTDNGSFGGLTGGTATAAATITDGAYDINTAGQSFSFSESAIVGDTPIVSQTYATGAIASPSLYGSATTTLGGTAGDLAGTLSATSIPAVTAGGAGTTAIGQRSVTLSVFR